MNWLPFFLICQHRGRQVSLARIFRGGTLHCRKRLHHPARTCLTTLRALFDDSHILFNVFTRNSRTAQSLTSKRQQVVQNQRRGAVTLSVKPLELSIKPMPCGTEKVNLRIVERHAGGNVAIRLRKCSHQAGKERSVSNLVNNCWARGQRAVLNSQMWNAFSQAVARSVPTPNS